MEKIMALPFIKGLDLCEQFFQEAIRPFLNNHFPNLRYAAGRLGDGSDVLGFDTPQSRDHDWGPRATLFLAEADLANVSPAINEMLRQELPLTFNGYPTHYGRNTDGTYGLQFTKVKPITHLIKMTTAVRFTQEHLALDATKSLQPADWLRIPSQKLATIRYGRLFYDPLGEMTAVRQQLHFYPHDVWLYLLAGQWKRLAQEEPLVGRTGDVGDDLGSRIIAARQIHNMMRLAFLMEKAYAPYCKWFGTGFANLTCAPKLMPIFERVWQANSWQPRETAVNEAHLFMARWHNELKLTDPLPAKVSIFHERPYRVIN
ncbi:MAG: DUF4037 domain-containing protein, partial [Chloroflexi bacterium]|nr:DUF4037 domain-containing protein [Chloroflexota bacterium]